MGQQTGGQQRTSQRWRRLATIVAIIAVAVLALATQLHHLPVGAGVFVRLPGGYGHLAVGFQWAPTFGPFVDDPA